MRMGIDGSALKKLIQKELSTNLSLKGWSGKGVEISRYHQKATAEERLQVQKLGQKYGCHTCGTIVMEDEDQPWIGDHIPPTNLSKSIRLALSLGTETYLFPQCHECMRIQANLVNELNSVTTVSDWKSLKKQLVQEDRWTLIWDKPGKKCIKATSDKVSDSEGKLIQQLGGEFGCHSCDSPVPTEGYHADHTFPREFCTPYIQKVFEHLGLGDEYPDAFYLRPQCPRCSGNQGGSLRHIAALAMQYAKEVGIPMYKV